MEFILNNGVKMPGLIFGTYKIPNNEMASCLSSALSIGFRHIDTASMYHNEEGIGNYLQSSEYSRESLFITTKAWPSQYRDLEKACNDSLKRLKTDYIDLYLLHWPIAFKPTNTDLPMYTSTPDNFQLIDRFPLHLV